MLNIQICKISVFHQIIDSSRQITENCTKISHHPKTPPTVTQQADESKYNAECISFWAGPVEYPKVSPAKSFKEDISPEKCIDNARYLLKTLLTTRHLTIVSTIEFGCYQHATD